MATFVSNSLTHSCLVDLTDVTLAFEDTNSKLLDVVSVADVDAKECVDDSLVGILKVNLCQYNICIEGEVLSRFWSKFFLKILKPSLVEILNLNFDDT